MTDTTPRWDAYRDARDRAMGTTTPNHAQTAAELLESATVEPLGSAVREDMLTRAAIHAQLAAIPQPVELLPVLHQPDDGRPVQCAAMYDGDRCVLADDHNGLDCDHVMRTTAGGRIDVPESDVAYPDPVIGAATPAESSSSQQCGFMHPDEPVFCTLPLDHDGPHESEGMGARPW